MPSTRSEGGDGNRSDCYLRYSATPDRELPAASAAVAGASSPEDSSKRGAERTSLRRADCTSAEGTRLSDHRCLRRDRAPRAGSGARSDSGGSPEADSVAISNPDRRLPGEPVCSAEATTRERGLTSSMGRSGRGDMTGVGERPVPRELDREGPAASTADASPAALPLRVIVRVEAARRPPIRHRRFT